MVKRHIKFKQYKPKSSTIPKVKTKRTRCLNGTRKNKKQVNVKKK